MKEFIKKNKGVFILYIVMMLTQIISGKVPTGSEFESMAAIIEQPENGDSILEAALKPIIKEVVKDELEGLTRDINIRFDTIEMQSYTVDIDDLVLALKDVRTPLEVDNLVKYWIAEGWTKKQIAIQHISEFKKARDELEDRLYSEEVFKTLMTYSK